jgi:hypothetical protein
MLADHYRMFGRYNAWANSRLLAGGSSIFLTVPMTHGLLRTIKYRRVSSPQECERKIGARAGALVQSPNPKRMLKSWARAAFAVRFQQGE